MPEDELALILIQPFGLCQVILTFIIYWFTLEVCGGGGFRMLDIKAVFGPQVDIPGCHKMAA